MGRVISLSCGRKATIRFTNTASPAFGSGAGWRWRNEKFNITVQDGGKTGAKAGVKLAYKHVFAPVFTSDGHPMLLVRPKPDKKMCRPEPLRNLIDKSGSFSGRFFLNMSDLASIIESKALKFFL